MAMTLKRSEDYWKNYERKREREGKAYGKKVQNLKRHIVEATEDTAPHIPKWMLLTGICIQMYKCENKLSYSGLAAQIKRSGNLHKKLGLEYKPSKSTLHALVKEVADAGEEFMNTVVSAMAAAAGSAPDLCGDSTGMSLHKNVPWRHAKYGDISMHDFVKLHIIAAVKGLIQAFKVTSAHAHDSPTFREMYGMVQGGRGKVMLDAAYYGHENCDIIVASGRVPVIKPRKSSKSGGYSNRATMTRWYLKKPDSFMAEYGKRNLAESVFSAMKERIGTQVRAKSLRTQTAELFACALLHNLAV